MIVTTIRILKNSNQVDIPSWKKVRVKERFDGYFGERKIGHKKKDRAFRVERRDPSWNKLTNVNSYNFYINSTLSFHSTTCPADTPALLGYIGI